MIYTLKQVLLKDHKKSHDIDVYSYNECDKWYAQKKHLLHHIKNIHESNFNCSKCGKHFTTAASLKRHDERIHKEVIKTSIGLAVFEKPKNCKVCQCAESKNRNVRNFDSGIGQGLYGARYSSRKQ